MNKGKSITFCTGFSANPVGGEKVIYELANRLVHKGFKVNLIADASQRLLSTHLPQFVRIGICRYMVDRRKMPSWFPIDKNVKCIVCEKLKEDNFPDSDYVVATAVETAVPVFKLSPRKGKKIYLIQGYENWNNSDEYVKKTYKLGMKNIVVSKWLKELVDEYSPMPSVLIPNAIDTTLFRPITRIETRNKYIIGLLYHPETHKGVKDAMAALDIVHRKYPQLKVITFGAPERPNFLPAWYEYHRSVPYKEMYKIYNQCAIFVCASIIEGFGLTGSESMACGCSLASTDYLGVHEYARNGENALLSPVEQPEALANNIIRLIEDDELRFRLANQAVRDIQTRSWDHFLVKFLEEL